MDAERSKEYSSEQLAIDWNYMERQFQDESFWAFISGGKEYQDRIDILFDFMTQRVMKMMQTSHIVNFRTFTTLS